MPQSLFERAENFIWENARLLDRRRFAYHFKDGSREDVLAVLRAFQNADGGFGNALEPDIRCPHSQPVPVQHALEIAAEAGWDEALSQQACDYLMTITTDEGGVPWLLPSALDYPRAPWWQIEKGAAASLNPTAAIVGLLHKHNVQHPWLVRASEFCWTAIAEYDTELAESDAEQRDFHTLGVSFDFLFHAPDRERAERMIGRLVGVMFSTGMAANVEAEGYVRKPLDWAPTSDHPLRKHFKDADIQANLDLLIASQQKDGGWPITWPPVSPACLQEWRGWRAVDTLRILDAYGRLER